MSKSSLSVIVAVALLASSFAGACGSRQHASRPKVATTEEESQNSLALNNQESVNANINCAPRPPQPKPAIDEPTDTKMMLDDDQVTVSAVSDDYLSGDSGDEMLAARIVRRPVGSVVKDKVDSVIVPSATCQCIKAPCHCASDPKADPPMEE